MHTQVSKQSIILICKLHWHRRLAVTSKMEEACITHNGYHRLRSTQLIINFKSPEYQHFHTLIASLFVVFSTALKKAPLWFWKFRREIQWVHMKTYSYHCKSCRYRHGNKQKEKWLVTMYMNIWCLFMEFP